MSLLNVVRRMVCLKKKWGMISLLFEGALSCTLGVEQHRFFCPFSPHCLFVVPTPFSYVCGGVLFVDG